MNEKRRTFPVLGGLALSAGLMLIFSTAAFAKSDSVSEAKKKLEQTQKEANSAAADLNKAQSEYDKLSNSIERLVAEIDRDEKQASALRAVSADRAIEAYKSANIGGLASIDPEMALEQQRREELLDRANGRDASVIGELKSISEDLDAQRAELDEQRTQQKDALAQLNDRKKALDAKLTAAEDAFKKAEARAKTQQVKARPAAGGRAPYDPGTVIVNPGGASFICPMAGPRAFANDWGEPRSGGRTHKGTDIFSPSGTPNVAVVSGSVFYQNGGSGGLQAYVTGDNGITYFYAHLRDFVGGARRVAQGEIIATTGNSGNASGGAMHTHFEIRLGGPAGTRVNPYPTLSSAC